jgi:hypothetical protein
VREHGSYEIRSDFTERKQDKGALLDAGVGDFQGGVFERNIAKKEDVDIDDAGRVARGIGLASEGALDGLCFREEGEGICAGVIEIDDGV